MKEKFDGIVEQLLAANIFLEEAIEVLERAMIRGALARCEGNQTEASKLLGIHRNTLQRKILQYELSNGRGRTRPKPMDRQRRARKPKSGAA